MHRCVHRGLECRDYNGKYIHLSIDEKAMKKGHTYISILSDQRTGEVIEVIEGRTKESTATLCKILPEEQRSNIQTVCTDMWDPFIKVSQAYFPKAKHCHDNFHLVGYLGKAVDKVRKREVKEYSILKRSKYLFLKDHSKLSEKQQIHFDQISAINTEVAKAWCIKENFRDIQFKQNRDSALSIYAYWRMHAIQSNIPEIKSVVEMFDRHQASILNSIETGASNARAEQLNGLIQELKTIGRGYRNADNFRIAILFFYGNLNKFPHENL